MCSKRVCGVRSNEGVGKQGQILYRHKIIEQQHGYRNVHHHLVENGAKKRAIDRYGRSM